MLSDPVRGFEHTQALRKVGRIGSEYRTAWMCRTASAIGNLQRGTHFSQYYPSAPLAHFGWLRSL